MYSAQDRGGVLDLCTVQRLCVFVVFVVFVVIDLLPADPQGGVNDPCQWWKKTR